MRARSREFRAARAFLDRLRAPVLAVPGNHDITSYWLHERFLDPLGRWRRFIAEEPEPVWTDGEIAVVGVNTASRAGAFLDWSQGRVGEGRLRRAVERLRALPEHLFRVVVAHHPFLPPESAPDTRLVGRAEAALAAFAANRGAHDPLGPPAPRLHAGARRGGRAPRPRAARRGRAAGAGCWWCRPPPPPRRGCAASRTPTTGSGSRAGGPPSRCAPGTGAAGPPSDPLAGCPAGAWSGHGGPAKGGAEEANPAPSSGSGGRGLIPPPRAPRCCRAWPANRGRSPRAPWRPEPPPTAARHRAATPAAPRRG